MLPVVPLATDILIMKCFHRFAPWPNELPVIIWPPLGARNAKYGPKNDTMDFLSRLRAAVNVSKESGHGEGGKSAVDPAGAPGPRHSRK